jgi:hypothetical protein
VTAPEVIATGVSLVALGVAVWAARGATRAAEATEGLLAAQLQPRIIDVPSPDVSPPDEDRPRYIGGYQPSSGTPSVGHLVVTYDSGVGYCSVPIRNVGPGLARLRDIVLEITSTELLHVNWYVSKRFVPSGEQTRISIVIPQLHPSLGAFADALSAVAQV